MTNDACKNEEHLWSYFTKFYDIWDDMLYWIAEQYGELVSSALDKRNQRKRNRLGFSSPIMSQQKIRHYTRSNTLKMKESLFKQKEGAKLASIELIRRLREVPRDTETRILGEPALVFNYTADDNWHLGLVPKNLMDKTPEESREYVLKNFKLSQLVPQGFLNFTDLFVDNFGIEETNLSNEHAKDTQQTPKSPETWTEKLKREVVIVPQVLPPFVPKEKDKGFNKFVAMNDKCEGKFSRHDDVLKPGMIQKLKEDPTKVLRQYSTKKFSPFMPSSFSFFFSNEANMEKCNGRTTFSGIDSAQTKSFFKGFRQYLLVDPNEHAVGHTTFSHITAASSPQSDTRITGNSEFNRTFCPLSSVKGNNKFYTDFRTRKHDPMPFLVNDLFAHAISTPEQSQTFKEYLENGWKEVAELEKGYAYEFVKNEMPQGNPDNIDLSFLEGYQPKSSQSNRPAGDSLSDPIVVVLGSEGR